MLCLFLLPVLVAATFGQTLPKGYTPIPQDLPGVTPELLQYAIPPGTLDIEFGALLVLLRETGTTYPIPIAPVRLENGDWLTMDEIYITSKVLWANILARGGSIVPLAHFAFLEYSYGLYIGSTPQGRTMLSAIENLGLLRNELIKSAVNLTRSDLHLPFASNIYELSTEYAERWSHVKPSDFFTGLVITG